MSKYMVFTTEIFPSRDLLLQALAETGFPEVETGDGLELEGWDRNDRRRAEVIVRRRTIKDKPLFGDLGFQRTAKGFVPIIDDLDLRLHLGAEFLPRLRTNYHEAAAHELAKKLGGRITRETVGKTVKIRIRY